MYAISEVPPRVQTLFDKLKELTSEVVETTGLTGPGTLLPATEDLFSEPARAGKLYVLREGNILWQHEQASVFILEEGDLLGLAEHFGTPAGTYKLEFAVRCDEISAADFIAALSRSAKGQDLWNRFLSCQSAAMTTFGMSRTGGEKHLAPCMRTYEAGQPIIEQGQTGHTVYSLVEGRAEVLVDGLKVGEIGEDEIFGVFAAITEKPRAATIRATAPCVVLEIEKERFLDLIETKPSTVCRMIEDLARIICDLDQKVVTLSSGRAQILRT